MKKKSTKLTIKEFIGIKDQYVRANVTKEMRQTDTVLCFLYIAFTHSAIKTSIYLISVR